jgi:magnesium chelatase subunit I
MNPEEGELRPQLLDRFGLCVQIEGLSKPEDRVEVMVRRAAFDETPQAFSERWRGEGEKLAQRIAEAKALLPKVEASTESLLQVVSYCLDVGVDGHRGDIITHKTARAIAAWEGREQVTDGDIRKAVDLALPHRVRRQPFQDVVGDIQAAREAKVGG